MNRINTKKTMKKYLFLLLIGVMGLTACGDDDPVVPKLNKLTNISCYKDSETSPLFTAEINYDIEGKISNMNLSGERKLLFIYSNDRFTVTDVNSGNATAEYVLSGNVITGMSVQKENARANQMYVSEEYRYRYSGSELKMTSCKLRWPKEKESGYEERVYDEYEKYTWQDKNVVLYSKVLDDREMRYEYSLEKCPGNFPLRAIGSFSPVGFEAVSPLNFMFGAINRNLPTRAFTYRIPNVSDIETEYTYTYNVVGDYITGMTIEESENGRTTTYRYRFEYNFEVASQG